MGETHLRRLELRIVFEAWMALKQTFSGIRDILLMDVMTAFGKLCLET